jgi:REP element-mobilizing transposase RayT
MNNHTELYLHLVWATWDRAPLLACDVRDTVYRSLQAESRKMRCEVIAIGGMEDHVHLLLRIPATLAPSDLVKQLKGASSHLVNSATHPVKVFRWQGGYGAFSVSRQHVARIRGYVLNQEAHHRAGQTAAFLEPEVPGDAAARAGTAGTTRIVPTRPRRRTS